MTGIGQKKKEYDWMTNKIRIFFKKQMLIIDEIDRIRELENN